MNIIVRECIGAKDNERAKPDQQGRKPLATYVRAEVLPGPVPPVDTPLGLVLERLKDGPLTSADVADWILDVSTTRASSLLSAWRRKGWLRRGDDLPTSKAARVPAPKSKPSTDRYKALAEHIRANRYTTFDDICRVTGLEPANARSQVSKWQNQKKLVPLGLGHYALPDDPCDDLDIYAIRVNGFRQRERVLVKVAGGAQ